MSRKKLGKPKSAFKVRVENDGIYVSALKQDNAQLTQLNYDLMKKYKVKTSDPVTNDVINRIFARHQQGMEKFKRTMADNSKSIPEWIEESIEEKIDDISYMSTLKDRIVEREEKLLKDIDILRDEITITTLQNDKKDEQIKKLKLEKIKAVEETKKEADTLMINKMKKHYEETERLKKETALVREQAQIDILTKDKDLNAKDKELGRLYKKINELESRNGKSTKVGR